MNSDAFHKAGFDHPCKATCSGWKQGHERGQTDTITAICEFLKTTTSRWQASGHDIAQYIKDNEARILK